MNSRKKGLVYLLLIGICFSQQMTTVDAYAAKGKATVGFYEVEKGQARQKFPLTGEKQSTVPIVKTGISILIVTIGMFAYRNLTNEERI
ncbi:hypothetical protein [Enterococcus wangshanyuanii]|uniref:Gram-positive cocci surface proteins LPxTG domain-containing protein n=1 Tax=Enterococcus wangshanyuanii TaxID=2005703 RepID=A0ABQ1PH53_9ENTE|nr:hypothetical protein [Enterococcus wangshanyuanii]GGC97062.1 hypothetical protein GCM10011573_28270 [Enterococcus wangshanyuanii]